MHIPAPFPYHSLIPFTPLPLPPSFTIVMREIFINFLCSFTFLQQKHSPFFNSRPEELGRERGREEREESKECIYNFVMTVVCKDLTYSIFLKHPMQ